MSEMGINPSDQNKGPSVLLVYHNAPQQGEGGWLAQWGTELPTTASLMT